MAAIAVKLKLFFMRRLLQRSTLSGTVKLNLRMTTENQPTQLAILLSYPNMLGSPTKLFFSV